MSSRPREIKSLTGLRWLAALLVFLWHGRGALPGAPGEFPSIIYEVGWSGVTIFFALSGFLLARLYFDRFARGLTWAAVRPYLLKRVIRIYPVYFFLLLLAVLNRAYNPRYAHVAGTKWRDLLTHVLMIHGYFTKYRGSTILIPSAWTLTIEESFYLLLPLICLLLGLASRGRKGWRAPVAIVLALVGFTGACLGLGFAFDALWPEPRPIAPDWPDTTVFGQMPTFGLGVLAGIFVLRRPDHALVQSRVWANATGIGAVALFVAGAWYLRTKMSWMEGFTGQTFFGGSAALMLLSLCGPSAFAWVLGNPILVYCGRISYVLYLLEVHSLFREVVTILGLSHPFPVYLLCSVLAAAIYQGVEKPTHEWLVRKWVKSESSA